MLDPISEEILGLEELYKDRGKELIKVIEEIQNGEDLSIKDQLYCETAKGKFYLRVGLFGDAMKVNENLYKKGMINDVPLAMVDALCLKFWIKWYLGQFDYVKLWEFIEESEVLLKEASQESIENIEFRRAVVDFQKSMIYRNVGDIDLALKLCLTTLEASEKEERLAYLRPPILMHLGKIYYVKGELTKSQNYLLEAIPQLSANDLGTRIAKIYGLWDLGDNYRSQGKIDEAIETYYKALAISKTIEIPVYTTVVYTSLIEAFIDKKSLDEAKNYLELFKEYNLGHGIPENNLLYKISEARILISTGRIQNLAKAENILRGWMGEGFGKGWDLNYASYILIDLCHIILIELQIVDDTELLVELEALVLQLLEIAEKQHSYTTLTSAKFLQGKLALIRLNTAAARIFLSEAQQIADDHGLEKLALSISREHDKLLDQLDLWEDLNMKKTPISERFKLASMEETIEYLKEKRSLEDPQLTSEIPTILLILSEGGVMTFSYPFDVDQKFDEEIFGSFLTAFNSFSDEFFSKGLDRAKFGEDMILMQAVDTFLVCYLFKGETYYAVKKLNKFAEDIQKDSSIWDTLNTFYKTNQVVELRDVPSLENLIAEVFIH